MGAVIFSFMTTVPAFVAIGIWIVYQIVLGYLTPSAGGGVAYAAHIGGFVAGLALIKIFAIGRNRCSAVQKPGYLKSISGKAEASVTEFLAAF